MNVITEDGLDIECGLLQSITLRSKASHVPHWGWWILWLIIFWPITVILLIMALTRKKYILRLVYKRRGGTSLQRDVILNEENFNNLLHKAEEFGTSVTDSGHVL